jgi:hypothetical protein
MVYGHLTRPRPVTFDIVYRLESMSLVTSLDTFHQRVISNVWLQLFTAIVRVVLGLAFIPPGFTKLAGHRFTLLPVTTPVGYFFDALYQAQGYYRFIGAAQVLAGILLLFRSTATIGAVLYFPIIVNILGITISVGFGNTRFITAGMALACLYLLCWDYDRWISLLPGFHRAPHHAGIGVMLPLVVSIALGLIGVLSLHDAWLRHLSYATPLVELAAGAIIGLAVIARQRRINSL